MDYIVHGALALPRGGVACIEDGKGVVVEVWDGELWITQEGDRRDYFVGAGSAFTLAREGLAIVYALRESQVTLTAPVAAYYAKRITLARPGEAAPRVVYQRARERGGWLGGLRHRLARLWLNAFARDAAPTTAAL